MNSNSTLQQSLKTYHRPPAGLVVARVMGALLSVLLTTIVLHLLRAYLSTPIVALLFLLPVLISTTQWGLSAGISAAVCSFLLFNFFFITPYFTFVVHHTRDIIVLFVFLVVAVVMSQLVGSARSNLEEAQAREQEVSHLYELSLSLANGRAPEEVCRILANKIHEVFAPCIVQIETHEDRVRIAVPETVPDRPATYVLPLSTSRGRSGKVLIWKDEAAPNEIEPRLLKALVSQGALALERTILYQVETQAAILRESDRLKTALLSSVSHELRTPLVTIKAAATSLTSGAVDRDTEAADELLAALEEEADRLNQIVGDLLKMSRIEAGALKLQRQWNVLAEIVDTSIVQLQRDSSSHPMTIDVSEDLPLISVDHVLMQQVFKNLISNSLKYAPPGTPIHVAAQLDDHEEILRMTVRNKGPQIAEEDLEHIFDKFHRVTEAERIPGIGLGLSICKGIVEAHGGRIWAVNLEDGLAFHFTLPLSYNGSPGPQLPVDNDYDK